MRAARCRRCTAPICCSTPRPACPGGARRHRADPAPHRRRLGARRLLSARPGSARASDGRHRRARAPSDRRARRGAADPADPGMGTRSQKAARAGRAPPRPGSPPRRYADLAEAAARPTSSPAPPWRKPLIRGAWLKPGAHLDLVGGYRPEMREADDDAIAAPASLSTPKRPCTRPATSSSRCIPACCAGAHRRRPVRAGRGTSRRRAPMNHAVQIGRHRARRPRRRQAGGWPFRACGRGR